MKSADLRRKLLLGISKQANISRLHTGAWGHQGYLSELLTKAEWRLHESNLSASAASQLFRAGILNVRPVLVVLVKHHFVQASSIKHSPHSAHSAKCSFSSGGSFSNSSVVIVLLSLTASGPTHRTQWRVRACRSNREYEFHGSENSRGPARNLIA